MFSDPWLERWLALVTERCEHAPLLEIGCGYGDDTVTLTQAHLNVTAFDLSAMCVAAAKLRAPAARVECRDTRHAFPEDLPQLGAVVASLSLHYFPWLETTEIVQRIWQSLRPGGILLCRLNSTEDHHFGAGSGRPIEKNFYDVNGQPKRFFDKAAIDQLFVQGWRTLSIDHTTSHKYLKPKAIWEVVLEKVK